MQINLKLELEVKMTLVDIIGTGLAGYLPKETRHEDVCKVFGRPEYLNDVEGKTKVQWFGRINELTFTIYDYKSDVAVYTPPQCQDQFLSKIR